MINLFCHTHLRKTFAIKIRSILSDNIRKVNNSLMMKTHYCSTNFPLILAFFVYCWVLIVLQDCRKYTNKVRKILLNVQEDFALFKNVIRQAG